jgi:Ca2+-binding EF-hand superfamily protein
VFPEGLYNAISSLSTGGLWAIPKDSPDVDYFAIGLFSATGIPLMALAMSALARLFIRFGDPDEAKKVIRAKVTEKELEMMKRFGLDDGDGYISRSEFILLCAVRLGAMDPDLIQAINDRFGELDSSGDGMLSYAELLENPNAYVHNLEKGSQKEEKKKRPSRDPNVLFPTQPPTVTVSELKPA